MLLLYFLVESLIFGILPPPQSWCTCTAVLLLLPRAALIWKLQKSLVYMHGSYRAAVYTIDIFFPQTVQRDMLHEWEESC